MQQIGGDRRESGHHADIIDRSKMTLSDHAAYARRAAFYHQRCCIG
jgi:hypothetical protein